MLEKIKIASLLDGLGIGGNARQVVTIDTHLNKDIFEHSIILLNSTDNARRGQLTGKNVFAVSSPEEAARVIEEKGLDIVYAHRYGKNEAVYDMIARLVTKPILTELNNFSIFDPGDYGTHCARHILISKTNVVKYCRQNSIPFDARKLNVVYGLTDTRHFLDSAPTPEAVQKYKEELGIKPGSFIIGRIARPVAAKWDDELLIFWKKISRAMPEAVFIVYGVPENRQQKLRKVGDSSRLIMFPPTVSDQELACFYSSLDVLVHASPIGECCCGTIAEAMTFGKPVVVTTTPFPDKVFNGAHTPDNGQIEQIKNGYNGFVVKNGTAMSKAVEELAKSQELKNLMGARNKQEVFEKYDVKVGMKTLEKILIESLRDKGAELSPRILAYDQKLHFYPTAEDIVNWFQEYNSRLAEIYGAEYDNTVLERGQIFLLKAKRKISTVYKIFKNYLV